MLSSTFGEYDLTWSHRLQPKKHFMRVWQCHQFQSGFLVNNICPEYHISYMSANDKVDNEMKPSTVHRSPSIYLKAEENSEKPLLVDHLMKAVQQVIASNRLPYLQMMLLRLHST